MNFIIYGGALSGQLICDYLKHNGHNILGIIDKKILKCDFHNSLVSDINQIPLKTLKNCDEIVVALGSYDEALKIQEYILEYLLNNEITKCLVTTVHNQKYSWQYKKAYSLALIEQNSALAKKGYFLSRRLQLPIDNSHRPLPWYTYPCIDFLEKRLNPKWSVFEYGSGYSTLWWATKVNKVVSVESDKNWYNAVSLKKLDNMQIYLQTESYDYINTVSKGSPYDIICIDGVYRNECVKKAINNLTQDGVIVFDNSDRTNDYKEGLQYLRNNGFKELEFIGLGTINDYEWQTSIFYREGNILNL